MQTTLKPIEAIKSVSLVRVPVDAVNGIWPSVVHWIDEAQSGSRYATTEDVFEAVTTDHAQMWIVWRDGKPSAVVITQINLCSRGKYCSIWICVGSGRENSQHLIAEIEQWAIREGCSFMRLEARAGWSKVLKQFGYAMPHVILEKDLS